MMVTGDYAVVVVWLRLLTERDAKGGTLKVNSPGSGHSDLSILFQLLYLPAKRNKTI